MLLSMTGFGKATHLTDTKKITVEIKSLNSKQLDLAVRIPQTFRSTELAVRSLAAEKLMRGKVDLNIFVENTAGATDGNSTLDFDRVAAWHATIKEAAAKLNVAEPADWMTLLVRLPESVTVTSPAEATEGEAADLLNTTAEALDALVTSRRDDGARLQGFFTDRIETIRSLLAQVPAFEQERVARIKERIVDSLQRIPQVEYDKGRLEQEMIFYIEKLDITEEKQRLTQHLDYFLQTMDGNPGQGKKLGFIAQEMGREINTLGSKSNQADMQIIVVKMKDELEQIKEQVLNVL